MYHKSICPLFRHVSTSSAGRKTTSVLISFLVAVNAWAVGHKVTVNPATGGSVISADTTGGAWTTLTGPIATESLSGDIGTGTIILNAPAGFVFNDAAAVSALVSGSATPANNINGVANNGTIRATVAADGSSITLTVTETSTSANTLTWQNIQVRPASGAPLVTGGLAESGSSVLVKLNITGSSWGPLAEVAGVPTQLAFIQQPPPSNILATAITPAVIVSTIDQFGNVSATATNANINVALANNPIGATLTGTTTGNAKNAPVTYANLQVTKAGFGYTLVASAPGFASVTSSPFNLTGSSATTNSLTTSGASVFGQSVTLIATITGAGLPTGTVTFKDGATTLGTVAVNATQATLVTSAFSVGTHPITAIYSGDATFASSTSTVLNQTVSKGDTSTSVATSLSPSVTGQEVTFTATAAPLAPAGGTLTGSVTFTDGANTLATVTLSAGQASYSSSALSLGSHTITATYNGDANFQASSSSSLTQIVDTVLAPYIRCACADGQIQFNWDAQIGVTYQLQSTADLTGSAWSNIGTPMTADTITATCAAPIDSAVNYYYRVAVATE